MCVIYERVAIIGIGMIGGSFALALKQKGLAGQVVGVARSEATRAGARQIGAADEATDDPLAAVRGADLVYIATPVAAIPEMLEKIAPAVAPHCTVTDAGSVKTTICEAGVRVLAGNFLGGHPMAGSEKAGITAARADLFSDKTYLLTPGQADSEMVHNFTSALQAIGARIFTTTPERHDRLVALSSHLPHLWVASLALSLAQAPEAGDLAPFVGSGLRDSTRIAASDPKLWSDIFFANRDNLLYACERAQEAISRLKEPLLAGQPERLQQLLGDGKRFRDALDREGEETPVKPKQGLKVAIDGPAGAGKSTVAREVASSLNYIYIDTGAMYRAVAYFAMQQNLAPGRDDEVIAQLAGKLHFEFRDAGEQRHLFVDGQDVEAVVRLPEVGRMSSPVSAIPEVRQHLVAAQRRMCAGGGIVMEGRDIGTVVLPDAEVKIFLTAGPQERARRRYRQMREQGMEVEFEDVLREQMVRDQRDSSRAVAPLCKASDAVEIVSDDMSREQVADRIVTLVQGRMGR